MIPKGRPSCEKRPKTFAGNTLMEAKLSAKAIILQAGSNGAALASNLILPSILQTASLAFPHTRYREATYAAALSAAIAPSETAVTTWRKPFARTSPAANTPGTLVAPDSSATM